MLFLSAEAWKQENISMYCVRSWLLFEIESKWKLQKHFIWKEKMGLKCLNVDEFDFLCLKIWNNEFKNKYDWKSEILEQPLKNQTRRTSGE